MVNAFILAITPPTFFFFFFKVKVLSSALGGGSRWALFPQTWHQSLPPDSTETKPTVHRRPAHRQAWCEPAFNISLFCPYTGCINPGILFKTLIHFFWPWEEKKKPWKNSEVEGLVEKEEKEQSVLWHLFNKLTSKIPVWGFVTSQWSAAGEGVFLGMN